jgi:hypothetical protein
VIHDIHSLATARGVLSAHCERCRTMPLGDLDVEHLNTLGLGSDFRESLWDRYPQLYGTVMRISAFQVQVDHIQHLSRGTEAERTLARWLAEGMDAVERVGR